MLKNYITPSESINDLFILDVGEETQASINPRGAAQRFRCIIHFVVEGSGILKRTMIFKFSSWDSFFAASSATNSPSPLPRCAVLPI